jgi:hypothetical protein
MYLWPARKRPKWLRVDRVLGEHGLSEDGARARREFSRRMETLRSDEDEESRKLLQRGWRLGAQDLLDRLQERITAPLSDNHDREQVAETMQARAARLLAQELKSRKLSPTAPGALPKGDPLKVRHAEQLHREIPMTLRWIADALQMGSWHYPSHLVFPPSSVSLKLGE